MRPAAIWLCLFILFSLRSAQAARPPLCHQTVKAAYANRSLDRFFDLTQDGSPAPIVTPDRLGEWVGATKRMSVYRKYRGIAAEDYYYFVRPQSRKLIGVINVTFMKPDSVINIYFNRYYQGRGYGSEAYSFALPMIRKDLYGAHLTAIIAEGNERSIEFHERFGFQKILWSQIWDWIPN